MNSIYNLSRSCFFILIFLIPIFSFSQDHNKKDVALNHLEEMSQKFDLTLEDISNYRISDFYSTKHNGVTHIYLQQQHLGIDVQNAIININVLPNDKILNSGNRFISDLANKINSSSPSITPLKALQKVINKFNSASSAPLRLLMKKSDYHFVFDNEGLSLSPINVELKYELQNDNSVKLVWQVGFYQLDGQHFWNVQVNALDGVILNYFDEVIHCNFDQPHTNCNDTHHSILGKNNNTYTFKPLPNLNETPPVMANTYNVFPMPIESPNHGSRAIVTNPSDTIASPFGWHDTDGMEGAEYTITKGNNVHAYNDIFSQNQSFGGEPDGTALLEFDPPFFMDNDTMLYDEQAAIVNLFYWNNIIHDVIYGYGFDEVAGNFQANNYGNGGMENDHVRAEGLDGSGTNNANFFTPKDGSLPRMQMFLWNASGTNSQPNKLIVTDTSGTVEEYNMMPAGFGAPLPIVPLISELVRVDDGIDNIYDACQNIGNGNEVEGKIALLDRGTNGCQNGSQVLRAQNEGAIAVIVCNNSSNVNSISTMNAGDDGGEVNIPAVMVSALTCDSLILNIETLTVSLGAPDFTFPTPGPVNGFDSDFDNGVIVHEYGHGISNRLTGGPAATNCLRNMEQAGEGWSDWFALVMTTSSADNADEGRGIGTYVSEEDPSGGGIREYRYSRDMSINPHVYSNINTGSVPHGVGSVWAVMIWDLYWNLVDIYGFDDDIYNGEGGNNIAIQLVMDGLKLQACSPSFLDSRDAILAADIANNDGIHHCLIWETFARRGLGVSAKVGGTVGYDVPLDCQLRLKINKTAVGEIMSGETLTYTIEVRNDSPDDLTNLVIRDSLPYGVELIGNTISCLSFNQTNSILEINLGNLASGESITCTYDVIVSDEPFSYLAFEDDIENGISGWTSTADVGTGLWAVSDKSYEGEYSWYAENIEQITDQRLTISGPVELSNNTPSLSFWHRYDTEPSRDGGRVEISIDGGSSWNDLRYNFTKNGYSGVLLNPILTGEFGFVGNSNGFINSIIDLTEYSGETVLIRFRFTSNATNAEDGWYIDNVKLYGDYREITNQACVSSDLEENDCWDATTVVLGEFTSAIKEVESPLNVSIFPNPTDGKLFLKIQNTEIEEATLVLNSIDGKVLKTKRTGAITNLIEWDLTNVPKGIYFLQIQTDNSIITKKVILQ